MNDPMGGEAPVIRRAPAKKKVAKRSHNPGGKQRPRIEPQPIVHAEAAVQRQNPRPPTRSEGTRDVSRDPTRGGAVMVMGRNGETLTRRHTAVLDKFDVPLNEIPRGWDYQWNAVTILNKGMEEIIEGDRGMHANGYRPVPASRHDGRFAPHGFQGSIVLDGLRLEERPKTLGDEARAEDELRAKSQVRDRTDALKLTQRQLPGGDVSRARGHAGGMKMSIDPGLDIPRSSNYELEDE